MLVSVRAVDATGEKLGRASATANFCIQYMLRLCTFFLLVPLQLSARTTAKGGGRREFEPAPPWKWVVHYVLVFILGSVLMYRLGVTVHLVITEELSATTFMCGSSIFATLSGVGTIWSIVELKDLLNSWEPLRERINETFGKQYKIVSSGSLCPKVVVFTWLCHSSAINAAALCLIYEDLPVCMLPTVKNLGLIPGNLTLLPAHLLPMAFYPLEVLTLLPPMMVTGNFGPRINNWH